MTNIIKIGIAGLGNVGGAVAALLQKYAHETSKDSACGLKLVAVSAKTKAKHEALLGTTIRWYDNAVDLANSPDIDVFVELIGGSEGIAKDAIEAALLKGHHVVSANKALLARHGASLINLANKCGVKLNFEAAVAGGIPIIKIMKESLIANKVQSFYAILNGTCNYILTNMAKKKLSFEECLKEAQRLGYAEMDPSFDVEGNDSVHKLALLSTIAFDKFISDEGIYCEGITAISLNDIRAAGALGYKIKLLAAAAQDNKGCELSVYPALIPETSQLAKVEGVTNAILIYTDLLGSLFLSGPGAGGAATASAVLSDIVDVTKVGSIDKFRACFVQQQSAPMQSKPHIRASGYFIRLEVYDKAGVFAQVAQHMAANNISLESIIQRAPFEEQTQETKMIILATHQAEEEAILKAFSAMEKEGYLKAAPKMLRIKYFA